MSTLHRASLVLLLLTVPCRTALADVIHVPHDHDTIQAAANAAASGDTIAIKGGLYEEAVVVTGLSDVLIVAKGKVVIDPPGDAAGLTIDNCTGVAAIRVRVTGATDGIVFNDCLGGGLFKCRVEDVSGAGIVLDDSQSVLVEKCVVSDTGGNGLSIGPTLPSSDCIVLLNRVFRAGDAGIEVSGSNNSIEENLVRDATGDGIRTAAVPVSEFSDISMNRVIHAGGNGFTIRGDEHDLFANKAIRPAGHGIVLGTGTDAVVGFCKVIKPGQNGLLAEPTAVFASVFLCKFRKAGADGLAMGGTAYVNYCKVAGAAGDGIVIGGDDGWWDHNRASGSGDDGFQLSGTGNTLTSNKAKGSKAGFDLNDMSGGTNTVDETNKFKSIGP
jgi:Right handed beta helix region